MSSLGNLRDFGIDVAKIARAFAGHPMTRRAPARVALNWIGWQLKARVRPGDHTVKWLDGTRLLVRRGMTGATGNVYYGLAEFHDMAFALHLLRPLDLFVDVGANVGVYTILATGVCGARAIAIEPIAATARHLRANLDLNDLRSRVEIVEACIGDRAGSVRMTLDFDTTNRVVSGDELSGASQIEVPVRTLDEVLAGRAPSLVKIDAEGYEGNVLVGARQAMQAPSLIAASIEGEEGKSYAPLGGLTIAAWMGQLGFVPTSYDGRTRTLSTDPRACPMRNLLFVRDLEACRRRLSSARAVRVLGRPV